VEVEDEDDVTPLKDYHLVSIVLGADVSLERERERERERDQRLSPVRLHEICVLLITHVLYLSLWMFDLSK